MKPVCLFYLSLLFILFSCTAEKPDWPEPTQTSKPWTRWWWMGNAVDRENIKRELQEMSDAGIGGVEITSIYGVKGEEEHFIEYLSSGFSKILKYTIAEAGKCGMGVDLPPGSGWRCGGPFVPEEKGLWSLRVHKYKIKKGEAWILPPAIRYAMAQSFFGADKNVKILNFADNFIAPSDGVIYVAERIKNGDKVKRACDGGEGWAIDTFDDKVTGWYLDEFWKRLDIDEGLIRCFFHDSFEYTGDFTKNFTKEFKKRRGYDLAGYLHVLAGDCHIEEITARVKSDYRETLSDLVLESFIQPMTRWAKDHGSLNRNQAHGSPGNILDLYAACDIPETEIFRTVKPGSVDIFVNKFASSAAHVTGQKLVSSESYTWLDEHWTVTTSDMVRATNRFFLAGINHMFFHGTCYSPENAGWPGWLFYASTQVNNRNPFWRELPSLFKYIERSQSILQNSKPENDLLVYWPYYDVAAGEGHLFNHLGVSSQAGWFNNHPVADLSKELMDAGYTFDYISDKQLRNCKVVGGQIVTSGNSNYKAIVVPETQYVPLKTISHLQNLATEDGIVFYDSLLPVSVPGIHKLQEREEKLRDITSKINNNKCTGDILHLLKNAKIDGETDLAAKGFDFIKMNYKGDGWYMAVNCGTEVLDEYVELNSEAESYLLFYPWSGKIYRAEKGNNGIRINLEPEELVFIMCCDLNRMIGIK